MSLSFYSRRDFLRISAVSTTVVGLGLLPSVAQAAQQQPRTVLLNNLHTGETLKTCYFNGKTYVRSELDRIDHICRDFRRNEVHPMDRRLFDHIARIQQVLNTNAEVEIISGYRSPATNNMLRAHSSGVAKKSYHMQGKAIDFRLRGVKLSQVRHAALQLKMGGVGYYPKSDFVHIDTGPVRSWRG